MNAVAVWREVIRVLQAHDAAVQVNVLVAAAYLLGLEDELYEALVRTRVDGERQCDVIGSGGR